MRDEDLKNVPQQIEGWRVREFLDGIGIKHTDVRRMVIDHQSVEIEVYATDAEGRRFREEVDIDVLDLSSEKPQTVKGFGGPKMHQIVVPLIQVWERPRPAEGVAPARCTATEQGRDLPCERPAGHAGHHMNGGTVWAPGVTCMAWTARPAKGNAEGIAPRRMQCSLEYKHTGPCDYTLDTGRIAGDSPQA